MNMNYHLQIVPKIQFSYKNLKPAFYTVLIPLCPQRILRIRLNIYIYFKSTQIAVFYNALL